MNIDAQKVAQNEAWERYVRLGGHLPTHTRYDVIERAFREAFDVGYAHGFTDAMAKVISRNSEMAPA